MAQKRYFEYQSLIKSKTSAEGIALAAGGIGVVHGFDKVSIDGNSKVFTISSKETINLTGSTGVLEPVKHILITPDGILTIETGDILLSLGGEDPEAITKGSYFVLASHQHIESVEAIIPTSFTLVKGDISIISELVKVDNTVNIRNWYTKLQDVYPEYNANTTIICALIEFNSSSDIKVYNPWYNKWPSDSDYLLDKVNTEKDRLDTITDIYHRNFPDIQLTKSSSSDSYKLSYMDYSSDIYSNLKKEYIYDVILAVTYYVDGIESGDLKNSTNYLHGSIIFDNDDTSVFKHIIFGTATDTGTLQFGRTNIFSRIIMRDKYFDISHEFILTEKPDAFSRYDFDVYFIPRAKLLL